MLEGFENRLDTEVVGRGEDAAKTILGIALVEALMEEQSAEGRNIRRSEPRRSDEAILEMAFNRLNGNWPLYAQRAETAVNRMIEAQSQPKIKDEIEDVLRRENKRFQHSFTYAVLVNLFSNTMWVFVSFALLVLALLMSKGWDIGAAMNSLIHFGKAANG